MLAAAAAAESLKNYFRVAHRLASAKPISLLPRNPLSAQHRRVAPRALSVGLFPRRNFNKISSLNFARFFSFQIGKLNPDFSAACKKHRATDCIRGSQRKLWKSPKKTPAKSAGGAAEFSPRREPWVKSEKSDESPRGANPAETRQPRFAPPGLREFY